MCADPKMLRLLAAELRDEFATRNARRRTGGSGRRLQVAACAAALCLAVIILL